MDKCSILVHWVYLLPETSPDDDDDDGDDDDDYGENDGDDSDDDDYGENFGRMLVVLVSLT